MVSMAMGKLRSQKQKPCASFTTALAPEATHLCDGHVTGAIWDVDLELIPGYPRVDPRINWKSQAFQREKQ
jgi:hypothetical protein